MALFPKRVDIDKASVKELTDLYANATDDIKGTLLHFANGDITVQSGEQARQLIRARLEKLGVDVGAWVDREMPKQYQKGVTDANKQLKHFGVAVASVAVVGVLAANADTLKAIMSDTANKLSDAITGMARSADTLITSAVKSQNRENVAKDAGLDTSIASAGSKLIDSIKDGSIYALKDSGGRNWDPEAYANMLIRTKMTETRNTGMADKLSKEGFDLVEVSSHGATDVCGDWEGEILSLNGAVDGYPTLDEAEADGLFHPNCEHSIDAVDPADYPEDSQPTIETNDSNNITDQTVDTEE